MNILPTILFSLLLVFGFYLKYIEFVSFKLNFYVIILFLLVLFLPLRQVVSGYLNTQWLKRRLPALLLFAMFVFGLFQYFFASEPSHIPSVLIFLFASLVFAVSLEYMHFKKVNLYTVLNILLAMSVISTIVLILQTMVSTAFDIVPYLEKFGLANVHHGHLVEPLVGIRGRGIGITVFDYAYHNFLPLFYSLFMYLSIKDKRRNWYFISLLILSVGILISRTDSVFVGIPIALILLVFEEKFNLKAATFTILLFVFIGTYGFFKLILPFLDETARYGESISGSSITSRLYMWSTAISMFFDKPLAGVGLGNFSESLSSYLPYFYIHGNYSGISAHSMIFDVLATGGLIGITLFVGYLICIISRAKYCLKNQRTPLDRILYASLMAYIVMGFFANTHMFTLDLYFLGAFIQYRYETIAFSSKSYQIEESCGLTHDNLLLSNV